MLCLVLDPCLASLQIFEPRCTVTLTRMCLASAAALQPDCNNLSNLAPVGAPASRRAAGHALPLFGWVVDARAAGGGAKHNLRYGVIVRFPGSQSAGWRMVVQCRCQGLRGRRCNEGRPSQSANPLTSASTTGPPFLAGWGTTTFCPLRAQSTSTLCVSVIILLGGKGALGEGAAGRKLMHMPPCTHLPSEDRAASFRPTSSAVPLFPPECRQSWPCSWHRPRVGALSAFTCGACSCAQDCGPT